MVAVAAVVEDDVLGVVLATVWSSVERCAVCVLWSGDVVLEVELVVPVEATEALWPVVSVDCAVLELGLVLAVDELVLVLGGVDDRSA